MSRPVTSPTLARPCASEDHCSDSKRGATEAKAVPEESLPTVVQVSEFRAHESAVLSFHYS